MATFRFGNGRNVSKKYAFKFNLIGELISDLWNPLVSGSEPTVWNGFRLSTGAVATFVGQTGDEFFVSILDIDRPSDLSRFRLSGGTALNFTLLNPQTGNYSVYLYCRYRSLDARFDLEIADKIDKNDPDVELVNTANDDVQIGGDAFYYKKKISGTIEGYFYENFARSEYISIDEYYPVSEVFKLPAGNCGDVTIFQADKPNKDTIRHFPKYTTLNWYEAPDSRKKSSLGVVANYSSKKGVKKFTKSTLF